MKDGKGKKYLYAAGNAVGDGLKGMCMAFADSVPGVSGGTIAFLMGFYDKFIGSIACLIKGKKQEKISAVIYLIKILIGWGIGFIVAILALSAIFEQHIYTVSSVFIGLTEAANPVIVYEEFSTLKGRYLSILFAPIGVAAVALLTYFLPQINSEIVNLADVSVGGYFYLFFAGVICIAAMVMPGISGSSMLMIFGLYAQLVNALSSFLKGQFSYFLPLFIFGLGIIIGIFTFAKLAKLCLKKFRAQTVFCILGLMIGSIYAIIMGPATLRPKQDIINKDNFQAGWFVLGALIPIVLEVAKVILQRRKDKKINLIKDGDINCETPQDSSEDDPENE